MITVWNRNYFNSVLGGSMMLANVVCQVAFAQGLPTELMDLSLEEINSVEIGSELKAGKLSKTGGKWHIGYDYRSIRFEGYLNGNKEITNEELLRMPGEAPSDDKYLVLPNVVTQELHLLKIAFNFTSQSSLSLLLPYVKQSTEHISYVPELEKFSLITQGLGDVSSIFTHRIDRMLGETMVLSFGVSFPTGSINEVGDIQRQSDVGQTQLPYSMQLGSGTYDIPISITYAKQFSSSIFGGQMLAKIRTGRNERDYRLGSRLLVSLWYNTRIRKTFQPHLKLVYQSWGRIVGEDEELRLPGPYPYTSPVTNPNLYGGQKISAVLGLKIQLPKGKMRGHAIDFVYGVPVYQYLNGPQSQEDHQMRFAWIMDF